MISQIGHENGRFAVHIALALALFLVTNWTGRGLYSRGYRPMSIVYRHDRAPALNAGVRILVPLIFLVLSSAALYAVHLDEWVTSIWLVAVYSVLFRLIFVAGWGRLRLLSWRRELAYAVAIIGGAYWLYTTVIRHKANLLPKADELSTEVWLITIAFLFYMISELGASDGQSEARKKRYVLQRARKLRKNFAAELHTGIPGVNRRLESLILAVMVFESFNRPYLARVVENAAFRFGRAKTLGLMQVTTSEPIDDHASVRKGIEVIVRVWEQNRDELREWDLQRAILMEYNPSFEYNHEVSDIASTVFDGLFPRSEDSLSRRSREDPMSGVRQMIREAVAEGTGDDDSN